MNTNCLSITWDFAKAGTPERQSSSLMKRTGVLSGLDGVQSCLPHGLQQMSYERPPQRQDAALGILSLNGLFGMLINIRGSLLEQSQYERESFQQHLESRRQYIGILHFLFDIQITFTEKWHN